MAQNNRFLIALGGNLPSFAGPPEATLKRALERLDEAGVRIVTVSRFYETPCFPVGAGPDYVNAAAQLEANVSAHEMLGLLHRIETEMGRERVQRWGMRTLDLDLLAQGDLVLPDAATHKEWRDLAADQQRVKTPDQLILPHPRLPDRAFVLVPLLDVAPDWVHPILGLSTVEMCENLPQNDRNAVVSL